MADLDDKAFHRIQAEQSLDAARPLPARPEDPTVAVETGGEEPALPAPRPEPAEHMVTLANIFRHREAHPYVLDLLLLHKYGGEWLAWEPETVGYRIQQDFKGGVSDLSMAKVQVMKTLHLVDTFWKEWHIFNACVMALNDLVPDFDTLHVPTAAQCAVGVDIADRVRTDVPWTGEVKGFLRTVCQHDGVFCPREPLQFLSMDMGGLPLDRDDILRRWGAVRATRKAPAGHTPNDEQLRRLLTIDTYLEEYRTRLRVQLRIADHV